MEPEPRLEELVLQHFGRVGAYLLSRTDAEFAEESFDPQQAWSSEVLIEVVASSP